MVRCVSWRRAQDHLELAWLSRDPVGVAETSGANGDVDAGVHEVDQRVVDE